MKNFLSLFTALMFFSISVLSAQTQNTGRIEGRVLDISGMPISNVQITIQSWKASFKTSSNKDGYYEIAVPIGSYQINTEKMPGFAATKHTGVKVELNRIVKVNIVPAVLSEGVLCSLLVTDAPIKMQKK